jgi:AAHS family 4-hydroxybenzoate transporter-like MFS transporter
MPSPSTDINVTELIGSRPLSRYQIRIVMLCGFIALLDGFDLQIIGLAAPAIAQLLHIPRASMGGVFSAALAGLALGSFGLGWVADRIGRKRVLVASTLCFGIFTLATPFADSYGTLLLVRFLTGLGLGGAVPCCIALSSEYTPLRKRATIVAFLWTGFPLGGVLGGLLGSWLIPTLGWQWLFWIGGVLPLATSLLLLTLLPESVGYLVSSGAAPARVAAVLKRVCGADLPPDAQFVLGEERTRPGNVGQLFSHGRALATLLIWASFFVVYLQLVANSAWSPILLSHVGVPVASSALAMAAFNFGSVIGTSTAGLLLTRFGGARVLPVALLGTLVAYGLVGRAAPDVGLIIVLESLVGLFLGCASTSLIALSALSYPTPLRSTGIGWAIGMGRIGSFVGPLFVGALLAREWSVAAIFVALAAPALLAALTAGLIPRPR